MAVQRPGGFVLAPKGLLREEEEAIIRGEKPPADSEIGLRAKDYHEIGLFNWQQAIMDMLSVADTESELAVAEGVRKASDRTRHRDSESRANPGRPKVLLFQMHRHPGLRVEQRRYLKCGRDLADVRPDPARWRRLKPQDLIQVRAACDQGVANYYERLTQT